MADVLFNKAVRNIARGRIAMETDTFYVMLVTSAYTPDADAHEFRSSVTNEITGPGYAAGGKAVPLVVGEVDTGTDTFDVTIGPVSWSGVTADDVRQAVVYKRRGGAAAADELLVCIDADTDIDVTSGTLTLQASTIRFDCQPA